MGFLSDFETTVTTAFDAVVGVAGGELLTIFRGAFAAGLGAWILLIAYETAWGKSEDGLTFAITKLARVFGIGVIALDGWPMLTVEPHWRLRMRVAPEIALSGEARAELS
jgi:type IV secretion system protein VirB6